MVLNMTKISQKCQKLDVFECGNWTILRVKNVKKFRVWKMTKMSFLAFSEAKKFDYFCNFFCKIIKILE